MIAIPRLDLGDVIASKKFSLLAVSDELMEGATRLLGTGLDYTALVRRTAPIMHRADPKRMLAAEDFGSKLWVVIDAGIVIECEEEGRGAEVPVVVVPGFRRRFWRDVEKCETSNLVEKHRFEWSRGRKPKESKRISYEHLPSTVRAHLLATARDFNRDAR